MDALTEAAMMERHFFFFIFNSFYFILAFLELWPLFATARKLIFMEWELHHPTSIICRLSAL